MTHTSHMKLLMPFAILGGILAVSTASILIRFSQHAGIPSPVIAVYRLTVASLVLAPVALVRYRAELRSLDRREWILALLSGFFLAIHFATWITSLAYTTVASSVVLVTTSPLWVALLTPLVLRERTSRFVAAGMILATIGSIIIGISDTCQWELRLVCPPLDEFIHGQSFYGDILALIGAWMAAGYLLIGRGLRAKTSLIPYIFIVYGMAAVMLVIFMLAAGYQPFGYPPIGYVWMILLALVPQLLGHSTFNWALRYIPATLVSVTLLGEPIGSTILAYFILDEIPSLLKISGAVLILIGITIAAQRANSAGQSK